MTMDERGRARAELAKLEADPKHTTPTDEARRTSRTDRLDDPEHNKGKDEIDSRWHVDASGNAYHPDYE